MPNPRLLIVDGNAILHRAWHAIPPLSAPDGTVVNAVYGFLSILLKALKDEEPSHAVVAFDRKGPTFRHKAYKEYKATREKKPDELYAQIPLVKEVLAAMGIPAIEADGFEADDLIATVVEITKRSGADALILTGDRDTLQLVDRRTTVLAPKQGLANPIRYDEAMVRKEYDLRPDQMVDYKALRGDPSDNIPGVKGVGDVTATGLLARYETLDGIYRELKKKTPAITGAVAERLRAGEADARAARELVVLRRDAPTAFTLDGSKLSLLSRETLLPVFSKFGFMTLLQRIPGETKDTPPAPSLEKGGVGRVTRGLR